MQLLHRPTLNAEGLLEYVFNPNNNDAMDKNASEFLRFGVGSTLLHKSFRDNQGAGNWFAHVAARKLCCKGFYALGYLNYGPYSTWELIRTLMRNTDPVKEIIMKCFVSQGQGIDFLQEELIKRQKQYASRPGSDALLAASIETTERAPIQKNVLESLGLKKRGLETRHEIDREADLEAFADIFLKTDILRQNPSLNNITSIDGTIQWDKGVSIADLVKQGEQRANFAIKSQFRSRFLSRIKISSGDFSMIWPTRIFRKKQRSQNLSNNQKSRDAL